MAKGEQVEIECKMDSNPKADSFKWAFNNSAESIDVPQVHLNIYFIFSFWIEEKSTELCTALVVYLSSNLYALEQPQHSTWKRRQIDNNNTNSSKKYSSSKE